MNPARPPFRVRQLLVCTHVRDPESGKSSCGRNGSIELRERLKKTVKARGLKGEVVVTQTGCLDLCPVVGCAVAFHPEGDFYVAGADEDELLLAHLTRAADGADEAGP